MSWPATFVLVASPKVVYRTLSSPPITTAASNAASPHILEQAFVLSATTIPHARGHRGSEGEANLCRGVLQPWGKTVRHSGSGEADRTSRNSMVWHILSYSHHALKMPPSGITPSALLVALPQSPDAPARAGL